MRRKRVFSLILVLAMILTMVPASVFADGGDAGTYTVTVKAAPSTVNLTFKDSENQTVSATDEGVVSKYHQYKLTVSGGSYSYVGTDGEINLGGDSFTVSDNATLVLVRDNVRYNGAALSADGDYSVSIKRGDTEVNYGTPYVSNNIKYMPTLLIAGTEYSGTTVLNEKWNEEYYLTNNGKFTINVKNTVTAVQNCNLPISAYKILRVTAPGDAVVKFFKQEANFVVIDKNGEITKTVESEDGTKTYEIKGTAAHSNYQYRAIKEGEVTQAGYLTDNTPVVVDFSIGKTPTTVKSELTSAVDDNSILLNIDDSKDTNELALAVGETYKVRAWRAAWEIVSSQTANQMIEPDMHYAVLSGSDVVDIAVTDVSDKGPGYVSGNANGNWMNVTTKKEGTAIVAVWYDAINITGAVPGGFFGASDPARYGIFVVNAGTDTSVEWNPITSDGDWDSEFDTVYYTGEKGFFTIHPDGVTGITVQNMYGTTLGETETVIAEPDGSYKVPVKSGANIITAFTAEGKDYFVVRAKQISYSVTNNTTGETQVNAAPAIKTGDNVTIALNGLDMPVPKMSGIYNPGYLGTAKILYSLNNSAVLLGEGTQYDFAHSSKGNSITFDAYMPGTNTLEGYISLSSMGDNFGNHRNTTDAGRAANMTASEKFGQFGILPEISFEVTNTGSNPSYEDVVALESVSILGGLNTYTNAFNFTNLNMAGKVTGTVDKITRTATWSKDTTAMSAYTLQVKATAKSYMNSINLKYWFDGETATTVSLTSGVASIVPNPGFDSTKNFNMEIIVTPKNPLLGAPKTYSFRVYSKGGKSAAVSYSVQKDGAYILKPQSGVTVQSNEAELFGYTDNVSSSTGVSALDVLVQAHIEKYGDAFLKETATDYLAVSEAGYITKLFGEDTSANGFLLNSGYPNDGTESEWGGYNGTTVSTQTVVKNDNVEFYFYGDTVSYSDQYTFLTVPEEVEANSTFTVNVSGTSVMSGYLYKDPEAFEAAASAAGTERMTFGWVDLSTGEINKIANAKADASGNAIIKAPAATGTYYLTALSASDKTAYALMNPSAIKVTAPSSGGAEEKKSVSIRIIGATKASKDVDYSTNPVTCDSEYVNWVVTTTYSMTDDELITMEDLLRKVCEDNGLRATGIDSGYVSSITAPEVLGGYKLAEFDNGAFSGWMYSVNGKHPNVGLDKYKLKDGDKAIWHYVNDYRYEVSDWYAGSLGGRSQQNLWLKASDSAPKAISAGSAAGNTEGGKTETVAPEVTAKGGEAKVNVSNKNVEDAINSAKKDAAEAIVIIPSIKGEANKVEVEIPKEAAKNIASDAKIALTIETAVGSMNIPSETLTEIVQAAGAGEISMNMEKANVADIKDKLPEGAETEMALAVNFSITSGGETISSFGGKALEVSFPVDKKSFADGKSYVAYIVSDDGSITKTTAVIKNGIAVVSTTHFSTVVITKEETITALPFTDVIGHWYEEAVTYVYGNKLMNGITETTFDPQGKLNRAMLVTVLYRMAGEPAVTAANSFTDVKDGKWYSNAVIWAAENKIVNGYGDGRFGTMDDITREQMAKILFAYATYKGYDTTKANELKAYSDAEQVHTWASDAMKWANAEGLINGRTTDTIEPRGAATRAETAAILMRYFQLSK